ncbi:MAG: TPM domain-containing protein [Bacillota bacterium]
MIIRNKLQIILSIVIMLLIISSQAVEAASDPNVPQPTYEFYCNDFADVLDKNEEAVIVELGERIFRDTDGGQVVFVSIASLDGYTIEEYANALFNKWKIGKADKGILFILSMGERESRIEVGYGYEGILTDIQSYKLLEKFTAAASEKGIDRGVLETYTDICRIVSGQEVEYAETRRQDNNYQGNGEDFINFLLENPIAIGIFIVLLFLDLIFNRGRIFGFILKMLILNGRRGGGRSGGGWGGGGNFGGGGRSGGGGASGRF